MIATDHRQAITQLRVSDNGVGMTAEVRRHIFEPLFTTKADNGGTGLGLATVYAIVMSAGSTIEVDSTAGVGSAFEVRFPSAQR